MAAEYNRGEIAHNNRRIAVVGVKDAGTEREMTRRFSLPVKTSLRVVAAHRSGNPDIAKHTKGYVYDIEVEWEGEVYLVENIPFRHLYTKAGYEYTCELDAKIAEIMKEKQNPG